jgi:hypothetical protein
MLKMLQLTVSFILCYRLRMNTILVLNCCINLVFEMSD